MNHKIKNTIILVLTFLALVNCQKKFSTSSEDIDYREEMRQFVIDLSEYAKTINQNFIIIPQNGQELITDNGEANGEIEIEYLNTINTTGREDMFYGYNNDDEETPTEDREHLLNLCLVCEEYNVEVLATDYCSTHDKMDNSYQINEQNGFISFAANERDLYNIPNYPIKPYHENSDNILTISEAKNFLYLINSKDFTNKNDFIKSISSTNFDVIIMDLCHNEFAYTNSEINQLKIKNNNGKRLVICYMSIGEAEDYRYYWQNSWNNNKPEWLEPENPDWEGNFKVKYWDKDWQNIIFGNDTSYLKKILDAGFDGVYLDIIDGFEYFE